MSEEVVEPQEVEIVIGQQETEKMSPYLEAVLRYDPPRPRRYPKVVPWSSGRSRKERNKILADKKKKK